MTYSELQVTTHFSFLRGASSPEELFATAAEMGLPALGVVDRNSVAGVVRALYACENLDRQGCSIRAIPGCRLDLADGSSVLVWPEDRAAWSRLSRLLTLGKGRADAQKGEKGRCFLHWEDIAAHAAGLVAALVPQPDVSDDQLRWMADLFPDRGHVCLTRYRRPNEASRLFEIDRQARRFGLSPLATGDVLYHEPGRHRLQDVVSAIREKCTIDQLGLTREANASRHLVSPEAMAHAFRRYPHALAAVSVVVERCTFSLRELAYQYPDEIVMSGLSPQAALEKLCWRAFAERYGDSPSERYRQQLADELALVAKVEYAPYFLTVHSIVEYARSQHILCQGRGSAANSLICFILGITSIDPIEHKLLFERFISEDRAEPPDIDVDFEHERREEVIQWIYTTYGHDHAALTAVVSRFRARGALREVGKALGLPEDLTVGLSGQVWGWSNDVNAQHADALGLDREELRLKLTLELAAELVGTPRHLSQHPGGFVLTRDPLHDLIPIEPAAMIDRRVIEWEKADIEYLGFMKVDILGLGMLGCMRRAFELLATHKGKLLTLDAQELQTDDPATFAMIQKADTLGVFQIESRAQMSMLPRLKPREFYDIVIQVAIVRPGPIQGDMVHPYLRRREKKEPVDLPSPELKDVLGKTLGVPLFQEQAMKVAIVGAGFSASRADELRKAMATFKMTGGVGAFGAELVTGMVARGYKQDFAERMVRQIEGFGSYGFPESHAASFAKIAYASSWMKCHHPDVFCAALLNAQPMGFYAPAQIVRDARAHGVEVLPPCVLASEWDTILTRKGDNTIPLRLGLRIVTGLAAEDATAILNARNDNGPFASIEEVWRRSGVKPAALERLAQADAFHAFGLDRREALWAVRALGQKPLPLLTAADDRIGKVTPEAIEPAAVLRPLTAGREVVEDYRSTQLSLRDHPLKFLRARLAADGIRPCADLTQLKDGARVEVAGLILVRQRPGSAKGVAFITLEDESGIANAVVWPDRFEANRRTIMSSAMLAVRGRVQKEGIVIHVVADRLTDLTPMLREVGNIDLPRLTMPGDGATHGGTIDPRDTKVNWPKQRPPVTAPPRHRPAAADTDLFPIKSRDFH